ncbi:MAG: circadian clock protein KaiC [Thermoguttaceae bacterium]
MEKVALTLYVNGRTPRSESAIESLRRLCEEQFSGRYELAVVDVRKHPDSAESNQILATPALIKRLPPPMRHIIGDLSDRERVLVGLEIDWKALQEDVQDWSDGDVPMPQTAESADDSTQVLVHKLKTGIPGFDLIAQGGLPRGRTTLVAGTAGSAKTVFAAQFLASGIAQFDQPGVFVTFEETPADIRMNMHTLGWPIAEWEAERKWVFVDASPRPGEMCSEAGQYDLGGLLARLQHAVGTVGAQRVALDSLGAIFSQFSDQATVRSELFRISHVLKRSGVTSVMTAEREHEHGEVARFGVEEFVADNVVILRNTLQEEKRRRTMEILKFRGAEHQKGEWPFTIRPREGIVGVPLSAIRLDQRSSDARITSGVPQLDDMCGGGFYQDSIVLCSGATGTGKTLLATHFASGNSGEEGRSLLFAFEESRDQLFRNAAGWGIDFEQLEAAGRLRVSCEYPEVASLADHLIRIKAMVDEYRPNRVTIDSLSALQRISSPGTFREFVIGLSCYLKKMEIATFFTAATPALFGGTSITEAHVSTMTDSIILLRYLEIFGEMRRGVTVLKMRGSTHDKEIREFTIDHEGMHVGRRFRNVSRILQGDPCCMSAEEAESRESLSRKDVPGLRRQPLAGRPGRFAGIDPELNGDESVSQ